MIFKYECIRTYKSLVLESSLSIVNLPYIFHNYLLFSPNPNSVFINAFACPNSSDKYPSKEI